uniref:Uncharacterized protein n=1 Tax=Setaria italica TaxID=4555 RepID=K3ZYL7_SETIT
MGTEPFGPASLLVGDSGSANATAPPPLLFHPLSPSLLLEQAEGSPPACKEGDDGAFFFLPQAHQTVDGMVRGGCTWLWASGC